jgi:hypothetical protein
MGVGMRSHTSVRHRVAVLVLAGVCLPAVAACGGDDEPSEARGTTTTTAAPDTTAPPTTLTQEQEVEAAFHEWIVVMNELTTTDPNPEDARLPSLVLEPQLTEIRDNLANLTATNQIYEPGPESTYEIIDTAVDASGVTASLTVCSVGADTLVDRDTGDVVYEGIATLKNKVSYRLQNGRWMMEDYTNLRSWDGVTRCGT